MLVSHERPVPVQNRLLAALPAEDFERLRPHLEVVRLLTRQTVYKSREPITHLYFPQMCMVSLVALADGSATVEVATVGNDGVVGLPYASRLGSFVNRWVWEADCTPSCKPTRSRC